MCVCLVSSGQWVCVFVCCRHGSTWPVKSQRVIWVVTSSEHQHSTSFTILTPMKTKDSSLSISARGKGKCKAVCLCKCLTCNYVTSLSLSLCFFTVMNLCITTCTWLMWKRSGRRWRKQLHELHSLRSDDMSFHWIFTEWVYTQRPSVICSIINSDYLAL